MKYFFEIAGWAGAGVVILGYALASFSVISATGITFQLLNGLGALGIIPISFYKKAYQPAILNCIWMVIAFVAIGRIVF